MFKTKREKKEEQYLKKVKEHQENIFESILFEYINGTLINKLDLHVDLEWEEDYDCLSEKDVKRFMKNAEKYNTTEELVEMRKEVREGFALELTLLHEDIIYTIVFNKTYLIINVIINDGEDPGNSKFYDKNFDIDTYLTVEEILSFTRNEIATFIQNPKD